MDFPQHSQHVLEQLNQQRQLGLLCDCTFVVDGVDFKAHKAVLAACSEYFKMLFVDQKDVVHLDISNAAGTPSARPGSLRVGGRGRLCAAHGPPRSGPSESQVHQAARTGAATSVWAPSSYRILDREPGGKGRTDEGGLMIHSEPE